MTTAPELISFATEPELDRAVAELTTGAAAWAALDLHGRIGLLRATHAAIADAAEQWAEAAIVAKGTPRGPLEGEEWICGPYMALTGVGAVVESLEKLVHGKSPLDGIKSGTGPGGRVTFRMLPSNLFEFNLFNGFRADIWLRPGVSEADARATAGLGAKRLGENGGVGLVLAAGNVSAIGPLDVLSELVANNRVSILKLNPTLGTLIAVYERAFAPLIEAGVLRVVNGAADVGAYLAGHPGIGHVHITGSGITHDMIVWGSHTNKTGNAKLDKPITSELGGVSPIIVVPGNWSEPDMRFQAENVATQRLHNAGHHCISGQVLILSADWDQKDEFLDVLREVLASTPARPAWYPGSEAKIAAAMHSYPNAEHVNGRVFVEVTDATSQDLLTSENFAPILGHTALPGAGAEFFASAVEFSNARLQGSLGACIIVAPGDRKAMGAQFDEILADLHYGIIGVNVWSGIPFIIPALSWGAYPGNTLDDVGSGIGIVHNSHLVEDVERSVMWGPFRPFPRSFAHGEFALSPKPAWFVTARSAKGTCKRMTSFAAKPSWSRLPGIFIQAFRA